MAVLILGIVLLLIGLAIVAVAVAARVRTSRAENWNRYNIVITIGTALIVGGIVSLTRA